MPTAINEQLKVLVDLQKIDAQIYQLKKELGEHPAVEKKLADQFEKKKAGLKAAEEDLKAQQLRQKQKEGDLLSKEEKIKKLQAQLYSLKTNKEYSAMELEINGLKADKSLLEEEILGLMDGLELSRKKVADEKTRLGGEEKAHADQIGELKKKAAEITASVAELDAKRVHYVPNIEPRLLAQYEKLLKNREGLALVPVKNNACGGCHLGLPPQTVNEIQMQDRLTTCESCARILYWAP